MRTFTSLALALALGAMATDRTAGSPLAVDQWTYVEVDDSKPKWGDFDDPSWLRYFGLAQGDVNGDGLPDIVSGRCVYLNPGDGMTSEWEKLDLGQNADGCLLVDTTGDGRLNIIAQALPDVVEFTWNGPENPGFENQVVAQIPPTGHHNGQGYRTGQIIPGGLAEIVLASQGGLYLLHPSKDHPWQVQHVGHGASDEGFAEGDVDGDGDLDLISGYRVPGADAEVPTLVVWFENPGTGGDNWERHDIGRTTHATDRVEAADLDGDGRMDVAVAEERYPGKEPDANLWIFLQNTDGWERRLLVEQYSMNNLDVADLDADGDIDIVTAEHKGPRLSLEIWLNDGSARFGRHEIDLGKESHLGARVHDMDGDGDLDVVSIGWDRHPFVHLWRNDALDGR